MCSIGVGELGTLLFRVSSVLEQERTVQCNHASCLRQKHGYVSRRENGEKKAAPRKKAEAAGHARTVRTLAAGPSRVLTKRKMATKGKQLGRRGVDLRQRRTCFGWVRPLYFHTCSNREAAGIGAATKGSACGQVKRKKERKRLEQYENRSTRR